MGTYLLKRLLAMIPTLLGITFITFLIVDLAPGDPIAQSMGVGAGDEVAAGGGAGHERAAEAVKAKKQLLGVLAKDLVVRVWHVGRAAPGAKGPAALSLDDRSSDLGDWPRCVVAGPKGSVFVGTESGAVFAIDAKSGDVTRRFEGHARSVRALAVSNDGATLASGDTEGDVRLWSTSDGRELARCAPVAKSVRDLAFAGTPPRLVAAFEDGVIRVFETPSLKPQCELREHIGAVAALAASSDGARFWSGGFDKKLREWDAATWTVKRVVGRHVGAINDLAVSADGRTLASASDDRKVRVFDVSSASGDAVVKREFEGHVKEATAVAVSADGGVAWSGSKDESIRGWNVASGAQTAQNELGVGEVYALAASPDGATVWSGSESWTKNPAWKRYLKWLGKTVTLDFDRSFTDERPVIDKIADALPVTIGLNVFAIFVIYLVSIPIGVMAAVKRGSTFDSVSSVALFLLYSVPSFWLGTILITTLSSERRLNVFPSVGLHSIASENASYLPWLRDWGAHLVLPMIVITYAGFSGLSRYVRTSMLETISQDYVRTARAKGLPERLVIYKHALRNSMITIVTLLAGLLPGMIGGSVIVETIFTLHGMGWLGFEAILERDYPVIMAITTFSAVLTLVGILLSDILYTFVDPRISHS
jgi:peptide/nickel transport system permease protein